MNLEGIAASIAVIVSLMSWWNSRNQYDHDQQVIRAETLMHFTKAFHAMVEADNRTIVEKVHDPVWRNNYWELQSSEFYFFHHGTIPVKMYAIWMTDVADLYYRFPTIWESHQSYLTNYDNVYEEMERFFSQIYECSKTKDKKTRYTEVKDVVYTWIKKNKTNF